MKTVETITTEFYVFECSGCGVTCAVTAEYDKNRRRSHKSFYCPNGCSLSYSAKSEEEKLRDQLTRERAKLDQAVADAEAQKRRAAGIQGELTKTKKRLAGGACPCCNRTFVNLGRHIAGQHPTYAAAES